MADELNQHLGLDIPVGKGVKSASATKSVKKKAAGGSVKPARSGGGARTPRAPITGKGKKLGGPSKGVVPSAVNVADKRAAYFEKLLAGQNKD